MSKYDLIGVDSNAFNVMAYVSNALRKEGLRHLIPEYQKKATAANYDVLLVESMDYLDKANEAAVANGYDEDEYDEDGEY